MIKKLILLLFIILVVTGCSFENLNSISKRGIMQKKIEKDYVDPYDIENPITLGLYLNKNETKILLTFYESSFIQNQDIISLEVYYTKDTSFTGKQKELWNQYYQNYSNIDNYKIGYQIYFETITETINKVILTPNDTNSFSDYIQVYLYDDITQDNTSYLTQEKLTKETIITSIKLIAGTKSNDITSEVIIVAFAYNEDENFEELEKYTRNNSHKITIFKNKV